MFQGETRFCFVAPYNLYIFLLLKKHEAAKEILSRIALLVRPWSSKHDTLFLLPGFIIHLPHFPKFALKTRSSSTSSPGEAQQIPSRHWWWWFSFCHHYFTSTIPGLCFYSHDIHEEETPWNLKILQIIFVERLHRSAFRPRRPSSSPDSALTVAKENKFEEEGKSSPIEITDALHFKWFVGWLPKKRSCPLQSATRNSLAESIWHGMARDKERDVQVTE